MKTSRSFLAMYGVAVVIAATGFVVAYHFVGAPPPRTFRLAAGAKGGAYYQFAHQYAEFMAARGIQVEVRETAGTVENLLKPENKAQLTNILTYHVVAGSVKAADVVKLTEAKTVQGQSVKITVKDGKVSVDGATVTATDIAASNGVIHVIDTVIMP